MGSKSAETVRRGSTLSDRQLRAAALKNRLVSFETDPASHALTGWVVGVDDYHFVIVTKDGDQVVLIHKSCPVIYIAGESTAPAETSLAAAMINAYLASGEPS